MVNRQQKSQGVVNADSGVLILYFAVKYKHHTNPKPDLHIRNQRLYRYLVVLMQENYE